jgi:hypothetical protein
LFAANPALGDEVLAELARDASNARLVIALAGRAVSAGGAVPEWQTQLLRSLIERGDFTQAHALWSRFSGLRSVRVNLFNPQFAKVNAPAPFNWTLGAGKFGVAEAAPGGKLQVIYYGRDDAEFASQLLLLSPGAYELRMRVAREGASGEASGLSWRLSCQPADKLLLVLPFTSADSRTGALAGGFTVPANCPAQQLSLSGASREFAKSEQVVVQNLQLVRGIR